MRRWLTSYRKIVIDALLRLVGPVVRGMFPLGLILFPIGWYGDLHNWWDNLGYFSNVFASFTAACFGIPFAVLVLSKYSSEQADDNNRHETFNRTARTLHRISESMTTISAEKASWASRQLDLAQKAMEAVETGDGGFLDTEQVADLRQAESQVREIVDEVLKETIASDAEGQSEWTNMRQRWRFVRESLLLQAESFDIQVLSPACSAAMERTFSQEIYPIHDVGLLISLIRQPEAPAVPTVDSFEFIFSQPQDDWYYVQRVREQVSILQSVKRQYFDLAVAYDVVNRANNDTKLLREQQATNGGILFGRSR